MYLQQPSSVQHGALGVLRPCTFVALGPLSPANPDNCGKILLGTVLWEPAPKAVLLTPGVSLQMSPNKVIRTSQEADHDLLSNLGRADHQWVVRVIPGSLALQCISRIDSNLQLINGN